MSRLEIAYIEDTECVEVTATVTSHKRRELALESIVGRICKEGGVSRRLERADPSCLKARLVSAGKGLRLPTRAGAGVVVSHGCT